MSGIYLSNGVPLLERQENVNQEQNQGYLRPLANTYLWSLLASGIILGTEHMKPSPNVKLITASYINVGIAFRVFIQANLPPKIRETMHNFTDLWAFELYEIFWQAFLNAPPNSQNALLNFITAMGGYHMMGDIITSVNFKRGERAPHTLEDSDLNSPVVNKIVGPSFDNLKGQILLKSAFMTAGVAMVILGFLDKTTFSVLLKSLGYFLASQGVGYASIEVVFKFLKERQVNLDGENLNPNLEGLSLKKKILRGIVKIVPRLGAEGIAAVALLDRPELYIPTGIIYGAIQNINQRQFQVITPAIHRSQQRGNTVIKKEKEFKNTALRIDEIMSGMFLLLFLGWFTWGMTQSDDKEKVGIGILMGSSLVTAIIGKIEDTRFSPTENGRFVNHLRYIYHHHPYLLAVIYLGLSQITAITDVSLQLDKQSQYICGLISLACFGAIISSNRIRNLSVNRPLPALTPPIYRMLWVKTILFRLLNKPFTA